MAIKSKIKQSVIKINGCYKNATPKVDEHH
jgi:hypothetical protein